jgi:hypothetical protein
LHWDPAVSSYRKSIEARLEQILAETHAEPSEVGAWLLLLGLALLGFVFLGCVFLALLLLR